MKKIFSVLKNRKSVKIGLLIGVIYFFFYLYSIGNISFTGIQESFSVRVIDSWQDKIFKPTAPFLWEPIAVLHLFKRFSIFISIPNLIISFLLSSLVFLNIVVAVFSYSLSKVCPLRPGYKRFFGFLPGLFTGFACCAPTLIMTLGPVLASFTVFFIQLRIFLIPISFLIMIVGLVWSLNKIPVEYIQIFENVRYQSMERSR